MSARYEKARAIAEAAANHWDKFQDAAGINWLTDAILAATAVSQPPTSRQAEETSTVVPKNVRALVQRVVDVRAELGLPPKVGFQEFYNDRIVSAESKAAHGCLAWVRSLLEAQPPTSRQGAGEVEALRAAFANYDANPGSGELYRVCQERAYVYVRAHVLPAQPGPAPVGEGGAIKTLRTALGEPFMTAHSGGEGGVFVRLKYETVASCQRAHSALVDLFKSNPIKPDQGLIDALEWYAEQARLCRLIHSEGDSGRLALSNDGGNRARAALDSIPAVGGAETLPEGVKAKTKYLARDGEEYSSVASAVDHNEDIARAERANAMLAAGASVWDAAQAAARFPQHEAPEVLKRITAETPLIISHWQCRDEPGYKVCRFENNAYDIFVHGDAGSWSGAYGNTMDVRDLARYAEDTLRKHPELAAAPLPAAPTQTAREGGE